MSKQMYMLTDLIHHHGLEDAAKQFAEHGRKCARAWGGRFSASEYLEWSLIQEVLGALQVYREDESYVGVGRGVERFFALHFTNGWNKAVEAGEVK